MKQGQTSRAKEKVTVHELNRALAAATVKLGFIREVCTKFIEMGFER